MADDLLFIKARPKKADPDKSFGKNLKFIDQGRSGIFLVLFFQFELIRQIEINQIEK